MICVLLSDTRIHQRQLYMQFCLEFIPVHNNDVDVEIPSINPLHSELPQTLSVMNLSMSVKNDTPKDHVFHKAIIDRHNDLISPG